MKQPIQLPLQLHVESQSFIDAMYGVLSGKGWFSLPKYMLSGMTGACFRLSMGHRLEADSVSTYNWMAEHFVAADLIGIQASQDAGFHFAPTFPLYRQQAVVDIKRCLDQGTGAVAWKDRFVIVNGYDEEKQLFYYADGQPDIHQEWPFEQFGQNLSPYWYYQIYEHHSPMDLLQVIKESFLQAAYRAEVHDPMLPESDYSCGLKCYDMMMDVFRSGAYDAPGAYETLSSYAAAKRDASHYAQEACSYWPALEPVAAHYIQLAEIYNRMLTLPLDTQPLPAGPLQQLLDLLQEAKQAETAAIQAIRLLLRETATNRSHNIGLR
ncbi:hypothetical protein [Paenibacillus donghaensis]|uniref:Butirosin biosynthesis protein H N-terminal domain-containing protein n=1 Tax=Paenibacillus donghaensis TaxID=414771 RepID=A0A2Z2K2V5_9BACL|nr:hypothetical protein [Paenibacillus donghaensis]ASA19446.1 hypothetical protein B9T62_00395 [Paenibacillus donghaensis]